MKHVLNHFKTRLLVGIAITVLALPLCSFAQDKGERGGTREPAGERGGRERADPPDRSREGPSDRPDRGDRGGERGGERTVPSTTPGPSFDTIALVNGCSRQIHVAIHYVRRMDNKWITDAWWPLEPGESVTTSVTTRNRTIYFFANDSSGGEWNGKGASDANSLYIVSSKFSGSDEEIARLPNARRVEFFKKDTGDSWGTYTQRFTCP